MIDCSEVLQQKYYKRSIAKKMEGTYRMRLDGEVLGSKLDIRRFRPLKVRGPTSSSLSLSSE